MAPIATEDGLGERVASLRAGLVDVRRRLHARPELAFQEHETAALAAERCAALGLTVRTGIGGTGVLADLDGGGPGPTVLVRADMDALPIHEGPGDRPARSEVPGVMHACGHDGHVAVALGVAEVLAGLRPRWGGRVRMCFQPAEETDEGAARMIAGGALEGVDRAVGLHLIATQPTGTVAIGAGVRFAGSDELRLVVRGAGGHAGMPGAAADPILVAADIALGLERVARLPAVAKLGMIRGGTASNVVPEAVELAGTLRTFDAADRGELLAEIRSLAEAAAAARGATVVWLPGAECPALRCDEEATRRVRAALAAWLAPEALLELAPSTGSDDMARFLQAVPGVYFTVGAGGPGARPHHHPEFDIDEAALPVAVEALTRATLALLEA